MYHGLHMDFHQISAVNLLIMCDPCNNLLGVYFQGPLLTSLFLLTCLYIYMGLLVKLLQLKHHTHLTSPVFHIVFTKSF
jgi:hypothetical protein